jgi:hypothetical protein
MVKGSYLEGEEAWDGCQGFYMLLELL